MAGPGPTLRLRGRLVTYRRWWDVAKGCSYATFFHSPLWHELACGAADGLRDVSVLVQVEDGVEIVVPLIRSARGRIFTSLASSHAGCYGGAISAAPTTSAQELGAYRAALGWRVAALELHENPLHPITEVPASRPVRVARDFTQILRLDTHADGLVERFSSAHRRSLKKGRSLGVGVRRAESLEDYRTYHEVYRATLDRWGTQATSRYPWRLFETGWRLASRHPEHLRLWLAVVDGRVVSGAWVFYWNRHAVYWHGASLAEFHSYRPNVVLHEAILRAACEGGYAYYDFNPSGGHEDVARFKEQFGAERVEVRRWSFGGSRLFDLYHRVRRGPAPTP